MSEISKSANGTVQTPFGERMRLIRFRMKKEQLHFSEEIRLIPRALVLVAVVLFVIAQVLAQVIAARVGGPWPEMSRRVNVLGLVGIVTGGSVFIAAIIFLAGYVNRDAKRRGMNSTLWTFLVLLLLPAYLATGFIIYFLVREPLPYDCPQCHANVSARFNFCPKCKCNLRPACPQCRREVQVGDRFCSNCACELGEAATIPATQG
ncbi:MAG: zinc ribbon domain-containing protein [Acidobacteriia bacterium]|nr:zinc ribbon domain-containing protein [Terriglobia bacterium]